MAVLIHCFVYWLGLLLSFYPCPIMFEGGLRPPFCSRAKVVLLCELAPPSLVIVSLPRHFSRCPAAICFYATTKVVLLCELAPASLVIVN